MDQIREVKNETGSKNYNIKHEAQMKCKSWQNNLSLMTEYISADLLTFFWLLIPLQKNRLLLCSKWNLWKRTRAVCKTLLDLCCFLTLIWTKSIHSWLWGLTYKECCCHTFCLNSISSCHCFRKQRKEHLKPLLCVSVISAMILKCAASSPHHSQPSSSFLPLLCFISLITYHHLHQPFSLLPLPLLQCDCSSPSRWFILCRLWVLGWWGGVEAVSFRF